MFKKRALFLFLDVRKCPTDLLATLQTGPHTKKFLFWSCVAGNPEYLSPFFSVFVYAYKLVENRFLTWV